MDLKQIATGKPVTVAVTHTDGSTENITARHTLTPEQIAWFYAGSALNLIRGQH